MASRFTYEIKKSGFNQTITVFDNGKLIYNNNSPTSTELELVRIAKIALKDTYPDIEQMAKIPSSSPMTPNPSQPLTPPIDAKQQLDDAKGKQDEAKDKLNEAKDNPKNFLNDQKGKDAKS